MAIISDPLYQNDMDYIGGKTHSVLCHYYYGFSVIRKQRIFQVIFEHTHKYLKINFVRLKTYHLPLIWNFKYLKSSRVIQIK